MRMVTDPLLLAVALGMLNPSALQIDDDLGGEQTPPPMLTSVLDAAPEASSLLQPADD